MKFFIKDFFSKCYQISRKLQIWSHLLKKPLIDNFIFVQYGEIWGYFPELVTSQKGQNLINDCVILLSCSCQKDALYKVWTIVNILNHFYSLLP